MRSCFTTPTSAQVQVCFKTDKLGTGERGAKSRMLHDFQPIIDSISWKGKGTAQEERKLATLPLISLTPELFTPYLKECGASYENSETWRALQSRPFHSEILDAIGEAAAPLKGLYAAIRSDEQIALGFGLLHTGFVLVEDIKEATTMIAEEIKKILFKDFSENMKAFKERLGLRMDQHAGAFLQPVAGSLFGTVEEPVYTTAYHINAITNFRDGDSLINIGCGIGGANNVESQVEFASKMNNGDFYLAWQASNKMKINVLSKGKLGGMPEALYKTMQFNPPFQLTELAHDARSAIGALSKPGQTLYVEAGWGESETIPCWNVLQIAEMKMKRVTKPDIPESQRVMEVNGRLKYDNAFGSTVCGRDIIESSKIYYIKTIQDAFAFTNTNSVVHPNKSLKNYAIVVNIDEVPYGAFAECVKFSAYSNAAALIFDAGLVSNKNKPPQRNLASHMNGAARAAGIPIIVGELDGNFRDSLKPGLNDGKLLIYANDAKEEAIVAKTN